MTLTLKDLGPIDPEDPSNVNVTIPVRVFFANSVDEDGNPVPEIISPLYTISNNSQTHALSVSIDEFSLTNNVPIRQHLSIVPTREAGVTLQTRSDSFLNSRHFFYKRTKQYGKNILIRRADRPCIIPSFGNTGITSYL
jgi:hypothetical protein